VTPATSPLQRVFEYGPHLSGLALQSGTFLSDVMETIPINDFLIEEMAEVIGKNRAESLRGKIKFLSSKRIVPKSRNDCGPTPFDFESVERFVDKLGTTRFTEKASKTHCHYLVHELLLHLTGEEFLIDPSPAPENSSCIIL